MTSDLSKILLATLAAAILPATVPVASANVVTIPNSQAASNGNSGTVIPFNQTWTFQVLFAASQIATVPDGSQITGLGFRMDEGQLTNPASDLIFSSYEIELSSSPNTLATLSTTFANNIGADVVAVYNSSLKIPAGSLGGGPGPNPFFVIDFTTPYTYEGGNLLLTLVHSNSAQSLTLDGQIVDASANTVGSTFSSTVADGNGRGYYNYPVSEFVFTAPTSETPEPSSLISVGCSAFAMLLFLRRRRA